MEETRGDRLAWPYYSHLQRQDGVQINVFDFILAQCLRSLPEQIIFFCTATSYICPRPDFCIKKSPGTSGRSSLPPVAIMAEKPASSAAEIEHIGGELSPSVSREKGDVNPIDVEAEKALVRRIDLHLIPVLFILYMCAFMDR